MLHVAGLYRAAVIESGTALNHGSYISSAREYAFQLGKNLDPTFNSSNSQDLLKLLQSSTVEQIQAAANKVSKIV